MDRPVIGFSPDETSEPAGPTAAERLERGALLSFSPCPFALPEAEVRDFLCAQRLEPGHLFMDFDPGSGRILGVAAPADAERLRLLLARCVAPAARWLAELVPPYAASWQLERLAFHPEEEATRKLRPTQRNDLLHLDVPSRPLHGRRLLRLFVNVHPTDARVWLTSLSFAELLQRYGADVGLPQLDQQAWWKPLRHGWRRLLRSRRTDESPYDDFLVRLHDFLKQHDAFQERSPKKCWRFPPGSAWLAFTDALSHDELRGRGILEHSYFISQGSLAIPELSPPNLFERACAAPPQLRAA
jgi:hypothetical protein